ncbi:TetR/AcrR family transcriptional regulator [Alloscardovia macacae]|nr:TetR/AcrR family transcriptional regulator [Alloscardovia macacae]
MAEQTHSPRWQRTHAAIQYAYTQLILTTSPERITVAELTAHARIHRKTFYPHYSSIEDVYAECVRIISDDMTSHLTALPRPFDYYDLSRIMFEYYTSTPTIEHIFTSPHTRRMADDIIAQNTLISRSIYNPYRNFTPAEQELINTFVVYSSVNVWRRWALSGKKVPMSQAITLLGRLIEHGIADLRAPYEPDQDAAIATYFAPATPSTAPSDSDSSSAG